MHFLEKWQGKTALITGASSGIGASFAELLAAGGCNLILTARRLDRLENLGSKLTAEHGIKVDTIQQDLSVPSSARALTDKIKNLGCHVDLLINNAGFGLSGAFIHNDLEKIKKLIQLNITSLVELTHILLPPMKIRGEGDILLVGSMGTYVMSPTLCCYCASKTFVNSFGKILRYELKNENINVTVFNPGNTTTEFMAAAGYQLTDRSAIVSMPPAKTAEIGLRSLAKGKSHLEPGAFNKFMALVIPRLPLQFRLTLTHFFQKVVGGQAHL